METVTVGCKLPHGFKMDLLVNGVKQRVLLRGNNSSLVAGGFGLTEGVDKEFFDKWMAENKALDFVQRGLIWAYKNTEGARKKAIEEAEKRHGLEPLNPDGDPRNKTAVKKADEVE